MESSKLVKLKTTISGRFGKTTIINNRKVSFDSDGVTELPKDVAEEVVALGVNVYYLDDVLNHFIGNESEVDDEKETLRNEIKVLNEKLDILVKENVELKMKVDQNQTAKQGSVEVSEFDGFPLEECQQLCIDAKYPKKEWKDLDVTGIRQYLSSKLKEEEGNNT